MSAVSSFAGRKSLNLPPNHSKLEIVVRSQPPLCTTKKHSHGVRAGKHCQTQHAEFTGGTDPGFSFGSLN